MAFLNSFQLHYLHLWDPKFRYVLGGEMEVLCYVYGCYAEASVVTVIVNRGLAAVCLVIGPYIIKLIYEDLKNTSPVIQNRVIPKKQSTLEKSPINTRNT